MSKCGGWWRNFACVFRTNVCSSRSRVCTSAFLWSTHFCRKEDVWDFLVCRITWWRLKRRREGKRVLQNLWGSKYRCTTAPTSSNSEISQAIIFSTAQINFSVSTNWFKLLDCFLSKSCSIPTINNKIKRPNDLTRSHLHRFDDVHFIQSWCVGGDYFRWSDQVDFHSITVNEIHFTLYIIIKIPSRCLFFPRFPSDVFIARNSKMIYFHSPRNLFLIKQLGTEAILGDVSIFPFVDEREKLFTIPSF